MFRNPFQQLYVGEKVDPEEFVDIFSHVLVPHAMPLFQPGHVVLSGIQGSGKSMLFKLFQPEVRLAYSSVGQSLPIPALSARFIGAGININTARCNEFGHRRTEPGDSAQELMFGDFFNYLVCIDIIRSVRLLYGDATVRSDLKLKMDEDRILIFLKSLCDSDIWEGYLDDIIDLDTLLQRMRHRIALYRRFMNGNDRNLNHEVATTKTSAGEPMKLVVSLLRHFGIVPKDVEFYILIDQYEELATIKSPDGHSADYRSVVNKVISRDPTLSYRIGTRGYAWRNHLNVFGSHGHLEEDRDYKLVELDSKLRSQEYRGTNLFPTLANDVFARRLRFSSREGSVRKRVARIADSVGHSPSPVDEARQLAGENSSGIVRTERDWPQVIQDQLHKLAEKDPLSAKLGEVWIRQKGLIDEIDFDKPVWDEKGKQYWRKERVELSLLQIASIKKQRAIIYGEEDILALSGGNVLVFLSICQFIWDYASQASDRGDKQPDYPVKGALQTIGIFQAAKAWLDRIPSDYGRSDDRFKLIGLLGEKFSTGLSSDLKMSNPGHNGISFSMEDLRSDQNVFNFLIEAVDYGNLVMVEHATRNKDRKRRFKFYLNPLYCPVYRIPYQRVKEPIYLSMDKFKEWLSEAKIIDRLERPKIRKSERAPAPTPLLDLLESSDD